MVDEVETIHKVRLVRLRGGPCLSTISFLIQHYTLMDRAKADAIIDRLVEGETVEVSLRDELTARRFYGKLSQVGVVAEIDKN